MTNWGVYGEEALAEEGVAPWLGQEVLTVEHTGETLSRYEVEYSPHDGSLREVGRSKLFETSHSRSWPQLRLFRLEGVPGDDWLKAFKLEGYAPRLPRIGRPCSRSCSRSLTPFRADRAGLRGAAEGRPSDQREPHGSCVALVVGEDVVDSAADPYCK